MLFGSSLFTRDNKIFIGEVTRVPQVRDRWEANYNEYIIEEIIYISDPLGSKVDYSYIVIPKSRFLRIPQLVDTTDLSNWVHMLIENGDYSGNKLIDLQVGKHMYRVSIENNKIEDSEIELIVGKGIVECDLSLSSTIGIGYSGEAMTRDIRGLRGLAKGKKYTFDLNFSRLS